MRLHLLQNFIEKILNEKRTFKNKYIFIIVKKNGIFNMKFSFMLDILSNIHQKFL